jgi:hypothetical protein
MLVVFISESGECIDADLQIWDVEDGWRKVHQPIPFMSFNLLEPSMPSPAT